MFNVGMTSPEDGDWKTFPVENSRSRFFGVLETSQPSTWIYIYIYIPGTCLSSILVVEPSKTRSFPIKTRVI